MFQKHNWYNIRLLVTSGEADIRVNSRRAVQLACVGEPYSPSDRIYIGGGQRQDWGLFTIVTGHTRGFSGVVHSVHLNGEHTSFKHATLMGYEGAINSVGVSLSGNEQFRYYKFLI